jgi:hypothetical protein
MRKNPPSCLDRFACFTIERKPGEGYQVTSAEGESTEEYKKHALDVLNVLGQPDPKGPEEYFRLIKSPTTPSGEYVHVQVNVLSNGEARYHQVWYRDFRTAIHPKWWRRLLLLVLLVAFSAGTVTGVYAERTLFGLDQATTPGDVAKNDSSPGNTKDEPPAKGTHPDKQSDVLKKVIDSSRKCQDVISKLKEYLSQEGLAAKRDDSTQGSTVTVKRSVVLLDDRSDEEQKSPLKVTLLRLNNDEVAKLLELLKELETIANPPKLTTKSMGQ